MRLVIISHTEHYKLEDGSLVGLGSTVTEINHLLEVFDEIVHLAMLHKGEAPASALPYVSNRIHFVPIPTVGGNRLQDKLSILWNAPETLWLVNKHLKGTDFFQFRAPTGIGFFLIPYLILFSKRKGWFKYAGNWRQDGAPLTYRFQKWLLEEQKRIVTINGFWDDQPKHCLTFENPCLTAKEIQEGVRSIESKREKINLIRFCFVGRLEEAKGIDLLIKSLDALPYMDKRRIGEINVVGDGQNKEIYKQMALNTGLPFVFHGHKPREAVHNIYAESHAIILPSVSEGFPKVLSEAMNYGCIPIVSNVSSIGHYIKDFQEGFLLETLDKETLSTCISGFLRLSNEQFLSLIKNSRRGIEKFTYSNYCHRIKNEIIGNLD